MRFNFFNFLCTILFFIFSIAISAQTGDPPITTLGTIANEGEGAYISLEFCLNSNDDLIVKTNVILDNLDVMGVYPNQYGVIPSNVPAMYVEYTINGIKYYVAVGNFTPIILPSGHEAFSFIAQSPAVNFSEECEEATVGYVYGNVHFRLVTPTDGGWNTYPACDYDQAWGMFSCNVYPNAPWCDGTSSYGYELIPTDPEPSCYNEWFSGGFSAFMYCDCRPTEPGNEDPHGTGGDEFDTNDGEIEKRFVQEVKVNAYPNPVENILFIESFGNFINEVEIFNSRGDLILKNKYKSEEVQNLSLITTGFPKGLYLVRIVTNSGIEVIKVLK